MHDGAAARSQRSGGGGKVTVALAQSVRQRGAACLPGGQKQDCKRPVFSLHGLRALCCMDEHGERRGKEVVGKKRDAAFPLRFRCHSAKD